MKDADTNQPAEKNLQYRGTTPSASGRGCDELFGGDIRFLAMKHRHNVTSFQAVFWETLSSSKEDTTRMLKNGSGGQKVFPILSFYPTFFSLQNKRWESPPPLPPLLLFLILVSPLPPFSFPLLLNKVSCRSLKPHDPAQGKMHTGFVILNVNLERTTRIERRRSPKKEPLSLLYNTRSCVGAAGSHEIHEWNRPRVDLRAARPETIAMGLTVAG